MSCCPQCARGRPCATLGQTTIDELGEAYDAAKSAIAALSEVAARPEDVARLERLREAWRELPARVALAHPAVPATYREAAARNAWDLARYARAVLAEIQGGGSSSSSSSSSTGVAPSEGSGWPGLPPGLFPRLPSLPSLKMPALAGAAGILLVLLLALMFLGGDRRR